MMTGELPTVEDVRWLSRLPMTNAVVAAMDVVQEVIKENNPTAIQHFVVGGASKRGWTTWITGAVDKRVVAIVPVSGSRLMDLLVAETNDAWQPGLKHRVNSTFYISEAREVIRG